MLLMAVVPRPQAVEATSLNSRSCGMLLEQDAFIGDAITENDYLGLF